jgi:hypothetical protein
MLPSMRSSRCLLILLVAASSLAASSSPQLLEALERETVQQAGQSSPRHSCALAAHALFLTATRG